MQKYGIEVKNEKNGIKNTIKKVYDKLKNILINVKRAIKNIQAQDLKQVNSVVIIVNQYIVEKVVLMTLKLLVLFVIILSKKINIQKLKPALKIVEKNYI
jgi:hypothetical protein